MDKGAAHEDVYSFSAIYLLGVIRLVGAVIIYVQGLSARIAQCEDQFRQPTGTSNSPSNAEKDVMKARGTASGP